MHVRTVFTKILLFTTVILVSSCSLIRPKVGREAGWLDWDGRGGWSESAESGAFFTLEESSSAHLAAPAKDEAESRSVDDQNTYLRAGSVDDNAEWDDYLLYRLQFHEWGIPVHDLDVSGRHTIMIVN